MELGFGVEKLARYMGFDYNCLRFGSFHVVVCDFLFLLFSFHFYSLPNSSTQENIKENEKSKPWAFVAGLGIFLWVVGQWGGRWGRTEGFVLICGRQGVWGGEGGGLFSNMFLEGGMWL